MPMHQTIAGFLIAALLAFGAVRFRPRLTADLHRPVAWLALTASACVLSAASALVAAAGHAGTGLVTRRGWPKLYHFDFRSEFEERSAGFEPLYFAGNALAYGAGLLLAWTLWRIARPSAESAPRET